MVVLSITREAYANFQYKCLVSKHLANLVFYVDMPG